MAKNIALLVLLFVVFLYSIRCSILIDRNLEIKNKYEETKKLSDSLRFELQSKDIEMGRYEIILDRLRELNPKLSDEITSNIE